MVASVAFATFSLSSSGIHRLEEDIVNPVMLPVEWASDKTRTRIQSKR